MNGLVPNENVNSNSFRVSEREGTLGPGDQHLMLESLFSCLFLFFNWPLRMSKI